MPLFYPSRKDLNGGVTAVFENQKKIEAEAKKLQAQVTRFSKQTAQWLQLVEGFNNALKVVIRGNMFLFSRYSSLSQEIGDIENWSKNIEQDMLAVATSLDIQQQQLQTQVPMTAK